MLDTSHVMFPNGAVTLVLILAESHLSIHTWPEDNLIAIDLFSCGAIDGTAVIDELVRSLRLEAVRCSSCAAAGQRTRRASHADGCAESRLDTREHAPRLGRSE